MRAALERVDGIAVHPTTVSVGWTGPPSTRSAHADLPGLHALIGILLISLSSVTG